MTAAADESSVDDALVVVELNLEVPLLDKGSGTPIIVTSFIQPAFAEKYY